MQTGRTEQELRYPSNQQRYQNSLKKHPHRIQIISKMKKNQANFPIETCSSQQITTDVTQLRRTFTGGFENNKGYEQEQLMKKMRQQLEKMREQYQQRFSLKLKQNSIEISRLNIKLESNNELITRKDALISELTQKINQLSKMNSEHPSSPRSNPALSQSFKNSQITSDFLARRTMDIEQKFRILQENQHQQQKIMKQIGIKIEKVQKQLIAVLGHRLVNMDKKYVQFQINTQKKINQLHQKLQSLSQKAGSQIQTLQAGNQKIQDMVPSYLRDIDGFRDKLGKFMKNQATLYSTSIQLAIKQLSQRIQSASNSVVEMQQKVFKLKESDYVQTVNNSGSFCSSKQFLQNNSINSRTPKGQSVSCFFDDYEEVFEELDSLCEDKFFHPLDSSFQKPSQTPKKDSQSYEKNILMLKTPKESEQKNNMIDLQANYRTAEFNCNKVVSPLQKVPAKGIKQKKISNYIDHNESFEMFSSEDEQEQKEMAQNSGKKQTCENKKFDNSNEIRFLATMKYYKIDFPVDLDVDINGMVKIKGQIKYLVDPNNKFFVFSDYELQKLRASNYIY